MTIALAILIIMICIWVSYPLFFATAQHGRSVQKTFREHVSQGIQDDLLLDLQTGKISQDEYQELTAELQEHADPVKKTAARQNKCSTCGAIIADKDKFCSACGNKLS